MRHKLDDLLDNPDTSLSEVIWTFWKWMTPIQQDAALKELTPEDSEEE